MTSSSSKMTKKIPKFPDSKAPPRNTMPPPKISSKSNRYYSPSHLKQLRTMPREPWIFTSQKIQENLAQIFKSFDLKPIDIEALIYLTLQAFEVDPLTYESMYKIVKNHILATYIIQQGGHVRMQDISMRKIIVYYTKEKK